jgi:hypothetical protein
MAGMFPHIVSAMALKPPDAVIKVIDCTFVPRLTAPVSAAVLP